MATFNSSSTNYGYSSPSQYSYPPSPFSSTPTSIRPPRPPRFAYSGPSTFPRPRSSASKPNPDSPMDSMANNFGSSTGSLLDDGGRMLDESFNNESSNYFSANDSSFERNDPENSKAPDLASQYPMSTYRGGNSLLGQRETQDFQAPSFYPNRFQQGSANFQPLGGYQASSNIQSDYNRPFYSNPNFDKPLLDRPNFDKFPFSKSTFDKPNFNNPPFGKSNSNKPNFNNPPFGKSNSNKPFFNKSNFNKRNFKEQFPFKKFGMSKKGTEKNTVSTNMWHCKLCTLEFTSQVTLEMHLNGAKHAKKLKAKDTLQSLQPNKGKEAVPQGNKELFCAVCNIQANSSLQMQMHLDGNKHKTKVKGDAPKAESDSKDETKTELNGNGSVTRPLPADFDEPQPTKLTKFSCDICSISVNSNIQLQQHLSSKKHQAKVEGKPLQKGKKKKAAEDEGVTETTESMETSNSSDVKTVTAVPGLASSFVQAEAIP